MNTGEWKDGKEEGGHIYWRETGGKYFSKIFIEGNQIKIISYRGKRNAIGYIEYFNRNGDFIRSETFKNGNIIETAKGEIIDGFKVRTSFSVKTGQMVGKKYYNKEGSLIIKREHFKDNKLVKADTIESGPSESIKNKASLEYDTEVQVFLDNLKPVYTYPANSKETK